MKSLYLKELRILLNTPMIYLFMAVIIGFSLWLFLNSFFLIAQVELRGYFSLLPWFLLFLIPSLTMRSWAEEKRSGTIDLLMILPVSIPIKIAAKFFALWTVLFGVIVSLLPFFLWAGSLGNLDYGSVLVALIALMMVSALCISYGMFMSFFTQNQMFAFIMTFIGLMFWFLMGEPFVTLMVPESLARIMVDVALGTRYFDLIRGVVHFHDIIFYLSFSSLFLALNGLFLHHSKKS